MIFVCLTGACPPSACQIVCCRGLLAATLLPRPLPANCGKAHVAMWYCRLSHSFICSSGSITPAGERLFGFFTPPAMGRHRPYFTCTAVAVLLLVFFFMAGKSCTAVGTVSLRQSGISMS